MIAVIILVGARMADSSWLRQVDALVFRIQQKESVAIQVLYEQTASRVYGIIQRILKVESETEDALQEVYIKVWQQSSQYSGTGTAWGWICVMARHVALDRLRKIQRTKIETTDEPIEVADHIDIIKQHTDRHWLGKCLVALKPETTEAILLSYVEGYSHSEISDKLSKPIGTVKAWIRRGLEELKQCLNH